MTMIDYIRKPLDREHRSRIGATHLGITLAEYEAHIEAGERRCYSCRSWRPASEMATRSSRRDGLDNLCLPCSRARARAAMARRHAGRRA